MLEQHHSNVDAKIATKVRFQEPGSGKVIIDVKPPEVEPTNEVCFLQLYNKHIGNICTF